MASKKSMADYKKDYTKPKLREKLQVQIKKGTKGGQSNQWSARKAQLLKKAYEEQGGDYKHSSIKTPAQKNLATWSKKANSTQQNKKPSRDNSKNGTTTTIPRKSKKNEVVLDAYHLPPIAVSRSASKGLKFREKFNRGGTDIGLARGHQLKNKTPISLDIVKRMYSYFCRHTVDKRAKNFGNEENPSTGYIAWLLWGGDAGYQWTKKVLKKK